MSDMPDVVPVAVRCDKCHEPIGLQRAACVQEDDVPDAPIVWFHMACLKRADA